jgi:hypothetical protein
MFQKQKSQRKDQTISISQPTSMCHWMVPRSYSICFLSAAGASARRAVRRCSRMAMFSAYASSLRKPPCIRLQIRSTYSKLGVSSLRWIAKLARPTQRFAHASSLQALPSVNIHTCENSEPKGVIGVKPEFCPNKVAVNSAYAAKAAQEEIHAQLHRR